MAQTTDFSNFATEYPNYFAGQYLLEEDFQLQHKYLSDRLRYQNQSLHVSGIVEGLEVALEADQKSVLIKVGSAIDNQGNVIVLKEDRINQFEDLNQEDLSEGELYIEYDEEPGIEKQNDVANNHTRWKENPKLTFAETTPDTGVKLAKITISDSGFESNITLYTDIREYSGLSLPNSNGKSLTLRSGGDTNSNLAVLTGSLKLDGNLIVDGNVGGEDAILTLQVAGASGGNPFVSWNVSGESGWAMGIDNSDSDKLKIGRDGNSLANNTSITLDTNGNVGIGTTTPEAPLQVQATNQTAPNNNGLYIFNPTDSNEEHAILSLQVAGASGGDPFVSWDVSGGSGWAMGIDNSDSDKLKIGRDGNSLANNTSITLDTNGNVGIGTNEPGAKLKINGDLELQEGVAVNKISDNLADATNDDTTTIATSLAIKNYAAALNGSTTKEFSASDLSVVDRISLGKNNDDGEHDVKEDSEAGIYWHSDSNFGIYRTSGAWTNTYQQLKIHWATGIILQPGTGDNNGYDKSYVEIVNGKGLRVTHGIIQPSAGSTDTDGILFPANPGSGDDDAAWIRYYRRESNGEKTTLEIGISNDADDHIALMPNNGNVGIGKIDPEAKLEINGDLKLATGVAVNKISSDVNLSDDNHETIATSKAIKDYADNTKAPIEGSTTQKFSASDLDVSGSLSFLGISRREMITLWSDDFGNRYGIGVQDNTQYFRTATNFAWYKGGSHVKNELNSGGGTVQMVIKDGNVGIGTNDPGAKLEVQGSGNLFKLKNTTLNEKNELIMSMDGGNLYFKMVNVTKGTGEIKWTGRDGWDSASDIRLKTNIEKEENILSRLMKLEVKNYDWKDNTKAETKTIGLIAQDVQPLFPSIVGEMKAQEGEETTLTLKLSQFGVLAVGGLKELKEEKDAEINLLKEQIQELRNMILKN
ncbi:MAG: tail fiber domain-containing protein [Cyanobacteria bacterium P01_H01_bin.35]